MWKDGLYSNFGVKKTQLARKMILERKTPAYN